MTSLEMLQNALAGEPDKVLAGFKTRSQWAKEWSVGESTVRRILSGGVEKGIIQIQSFRIKNGQRGLYPVPHYKLCLK